MKIEQLLSSKNNALSESWELLSSKNNGLSESWELYTGTVWGP